jgi:hypothetical protein
MTQSRDREPVAGALAVAAYVAHRDGVSSADFLSLARLYFDVLAQPDGKNALIEGAAALANTETKRSA